MNRQMPPLPPDPQYDAWRTSKTPDQWHRMYERAAPVLHQIQQFMMDQAYFAGCDLYLIERNLLPTPDAETMAALEHVADHLDEDPRLVFRLWAVRNEMTDRGDRWPVIRRGYLAARGAA